MTNLAKTMAEPYPKQLLKADLERKFKITKRQKKAWELVFGERLTLGHSGDRRRAPTGGDQTKGDT